MIDIDSGYPYERFAFTEVANVQRQTAKLRLENSQLQNGLYFALRRLGQINTILEEMGIDIDIILATKKVFAE